ncbi:5-(carboxyamino)imidazole ribonucleotide synthase [Mycoplasmatota bacterium]|nr:5-(carboxyamino)imidazole ribonucleotide synthase [Mycoplasmatota bacterium]
MKVGIIGGGQLGQMLAISAKSKGYSVICLDPTPDSPCSKVADEQIVAPFDDFTKIKELCEKSDVVTYEFENIPHQIIETLGSEYNIPQGHRPLYYSQHRVREKLAAAECGLKTAPFYPVSSKKELIKALNNLGYPSLLKTCSFGYDGKGQVKISSDKDLTEAFELVENTECILEGFVEFDSEISVIAVRNSSNDVAMLPIPRNKHINNILHMSVLPNDELASVNKLASSMVKTFIQKMEFVGILTVELFVSGEDIYFNEMAPRPHNSGHYSIEGCESSQFDLALDAIMNKKITNQSLKQPTVMINILGQHMEGLKDFKCDESFVHLYGKKEIKHNRKMGHITFINKTQKDVENIINKYWEFK